MLEGFDQLRRQLDRVESVAAMSSVRLDALVVDAGAPPTDEGIGPALDELIEGARQGGQGGVLVVAGTRHLAYRASAATETLARLLGAGFVVKDASGELHPDPATVELFRAAAREQGFPAVLPAMTPSEAVPGGPAPVRSDDLAGGRLPCPDEATRSPR